MSHRNSKRQSIMKTFEGVAINFMTETEYRKFKNIPTSTPQPRHKNDFSADYYLSEPTTNPGKDLLPPEYDEEEDDMYF